MRILASIGVAAALAVGPAAAASPLQNAEAVKVTPTISRDLGASGGASTQGFLHDINCFFFKRC